MRLRRNHSKPQKLPEPITLDIVRYSHDGRGIGYHEGRVVMVGNAMPGEQVLVSIEKANSKLWQGRVKSMLRASERRQEPRCSHYGRCGGCQLQHVEHTEQLEIKHKTVADHFSRQKIVDLKWQDAVVSHEFEYRHRARFHVSKAGVLGFHAANGNEVVPIEICPVLVPELQKAMNVARLDAPLKGLIQIELVVDDGGVIGCSVVKGRGDAADKFYAWAESQAWVVKAPLNYRAGEVTVQALPGEFTQVNRQVNSRMLDRGVEWLGPVLDDRVIDLFCGNGNFSYRIEAKVASLLGLEASQEAISHANAVTQKPKGWKFEEMDLFSSDIQANLSVMQLNPSMAIIDPPRAGAELVCNSLAKMPNLQKILYVSCDPATLARDVNTLQQKRWRLKKIALIDMFPQTRHIETMVLLEK